MQELVKVGLHVMQSRPSSGKNSLSNLGICVMCSLISDRRMAFAETLLGWNDWPQFGNVLWHDKAVVYICRFMN
jgi:hypothetical protein